MKLLKSALLGSAAAFAVAGAAQAADLPVKKAVPVEYVRICTAYGAGFFYIPGTDTCIRLSGRARFEYGYQAGYQRNVGGTGTGNGDISGYRGLARINIDARTQTGYGTLRAFLRIEAASRTGIPTIHSGTQIRIANAFPATGVDGYGRVEQYINTDKAFVQFAGLTAGRASSFFDFYAHDFEFIAATSGSDAFSTNLVAYTATLGNGLSATLSVEDPSFRRTPIYSSQAAAAGAAAATTSSSALIFAQTNALSPVFIGYSAAGGPTGLGFVDITERNRMPDFVGVLRYDAPWGSAQLSAAMHELNTGLLSQSAFIGTNLGTAVTALNNRPIRATPSEYGYAVQGGLKLNLPFIAPGDTLYLQGAYAHGAQLYTGVSSFTGSYTQSTSGIEGAGYSPFFSDAVLNPISNRLQLTDSFSAVASLLHYWSPEWRSAVFGSYGEVDFARGARFNQGSYFGLLGTGPGVPGSRYFLYSAALRDNYQVVAGASLIWSPVKDLDIGVEGMYSQVGVTNGRVLDLNKLPGQTAAYVNALANPIRTITNVDTFQARFRVQRDF